MYPPSELKVKLLAVPEGHPLVLRLPQRQVMDAAYVRASLARIGEEIVRGKFGERCVILEGWEPDPLVTLNAVLSAGCATKPFSSRLSRARRGGSRAGWPPTSNRL